jgi:hypothetical protein
MSDPKAGDQVIHRTKLFGGQSVEEVYFGTVFRNKRCTRCASPKVCLRIQIFIAVADIADDRVRAEVQRAINRRRLSPVQLTHGQGIKAGEVYACAACRKDLEVAAAHGPSYAVVTMDRLPEADKPLVAVV